MEGAARSRGREERATTNGLVMDFTSSFHRSKRPRSEDADADEPQAKSPSRRTSWPAHMEEEEIDDSYSYSCGASNNQDTVSELMRLTAAAATAKSVSSWRLPRNQSVEDSQQYLNEQLEHVAAMSAVSGSSAKDGGAEVNGTRAALAKQSGAQDDVDRVCRLDLGQVWQAVAADQGGQDSQKQEAAEKALRDILDLVSYLLYVRNQELEHQNRLSETLSGMEKQLKRKTHVVQSLTAELEALKQNSAQQQNIFKAKEQALITERKSLLAEKKTLEVNCARLQGVETAFKAKLRRKDTEYTRLQKNLQDSVARSAKEKRGIVLSKTLNGVKERKKAAAASNSKEHKLTKQIMENLERKKAELLFDNEALGKNYDTLQRQLESLASRYKKTVQLFLAQKTVGGDTTELEKLASAPIDDFTPTPFNMATKQKLPQYISESMEALNGKLKHLEEVIRDEKPLAEAKTDKNVIEILRKKLDEAHAVIREQDQLLQASLSSPARDVRLTRAGTHSKSAAKMRLGSREAAESRSSAKSIEFSPNGDASEELEYAKRELALQRKNLEKERKMLQEQAVKLDKDRLEFEVAKQDLVFGSPKETLRSRSSNCENHTPVRQHKAKRQEADGPDSPFEVAVSATPATAALLKKMGIITPTETSPNVE